MYLNKNLYVAGANLQGFLAVRAFSVNGRDPWIGRHGQHPFWIRNFMEPGICRAPKWQGQRKSPDQPRSKSASNMPGARGRDRTPFINKQLPMRGVGLA